MLDVVHHTQAGYYAYVMGHYADVVGYYVFGGMNTNTHRGCLFSTKENLKLKLDA